MKTLLVLAGGFGTRLRSLVSDVPKPLAPVLGRPFIEYLTKNWINQGVSEFVFLLHYEAHKIQTILNLMSRNREFSMATFKVLIENKPLGTGGAVMNAIDLLNLKESFLVANADTWLGSGIKEIANLEPCSIGAVWSSNTERYGLIEFNQNKGDNVKAGQVIGFTKIDSNKSDKFFFQQRVNNNPIKFMFSH